LDSFETERFGAVQTLAIVDSCIKLVQRRIDSFHSSNFNFFALDTTLGSMSSVESGDEKGIVEDDKREVIENNIKTKERENM
jgi:hypothetical protein